VLCYCGLFHINAATWLCSRAAPGGGVSSSNYGTAGRPVSLPLSRQQRLLSSSDPDLPSSNPASPENDMSAYSGQFRTYHCSMLSCDQSC